MPKEWFLSGAAYSLAKPVSFTGIRAWQVWPNPSTGHFTLQYQLGNGEEADMILYNTSGMVLGRLKLTGTGFMQNLELDLAGAVYPAGVYFLKILSSQPRVMKLVKLEK